MARDLGLKRSTVTQDEIRRIVEGEHDDPFEVLGMHAVAVAGVPALALRVFLPGAVAVRVRSEQNVHAMAQMHPAGFFEALVDEGQCVSPYQLEIDYAATSGQRIYDPYAFPTVLSDYDLHLFGESTHLQIYEKLGAHPTVLQGVEGVAFGVWAPNALRVSVVGDFNAWDGRRHAMRRRGAAGVWELFIPELAVGQLYKYEIRTPDGQLLVKSDPYGTRMELRPQTASIVHRLTDDLWQDDKWMQARRQTDYLQAPVSIYELHLDSWRGQGENYRELAHELVDYVKEMGYTHIELLPVMEHPLDQSWGYQVIGYFAPTSRHGTPEDFQYFVDYCHRHQIGVILDWVPAHFPKDAHGLAQFDGTFLYEHADPRQGAHPDWGTSIFNYGRNEVRNFLCANALYWFDKFHIDGLRVDAVASMLYLDYSRGRDEWIPNRHGGRENLEAVSFIQELNKAIYARFPGALMIAEESTSWPGVSRPVYLGGLGFGFKWNMGWMHDALQYFSKDPVHRKYHHDHLTFGLVYAFSENFVLVLSHDEVVHGKGSLLNKMPGDNWQKFANLRLLYSFMYGHPGKKHLFMGGEIGQWTEWDHRRDLDWALLEHEPHAKLRHFVADLNRLYCSEPALYQSDCAPMGFEWIDFRDTEQSVVAFLRRSADGERSLICAYNFTSVPRSGYRIGVPEPGLYQEVLNSDAESYGGSNMGNEGNVRAEQMAWHGYACSLQMTVPPLGCVMLTKLP